MHEREGAWGHGGTVPRCYNRKESAEKRDALAYYTHLLVKNQSPQALEVETALERLEGHWSEDRIASAARTVAMAAQSKYGSEIDVGATPSNVDASERGAMEKIGIAVTELREMSQQK